MAGLGIYIARYFVLHAHAGSIDGPPHSYCSIIMKYNGLLIAT